MNTFLWLVLCLISFLCGAFAMLVVWMLDVKRGLKNIKEVIIPELKLVSDEPIAE